MSLLRKYIVPTFIISQNTLCDELVLENKDNWVIKDSSMRNKVGVIFGCEVSKSDWIQLVK
jgi:hypothetical protein